MAYVYVCCYLYRKLRSLPLMQCLVNLSLSQALTYLVLAVSFERSESAPTCLALGVLLQYFYLVTLSWQMAYPVLACLRIFQRLLYEKCWLIFPFAAACWGKQLRVVWWPRVSCLLCIQFGLLCQWQCMEESDMKSLPRMLPSCMSQEVRE